MRHLIYLIFGLGYAVITGLLILVWFGCNLAVWTFIPWAAPVTSVLIPLALCYGVGKIIGDLRI